MSFPKPARGAFTAERRKTRRKVSAEERLIKRDAKKRDHYRCRWPHCDCGLKRLPVESAHFIQHKGMGGDPTGVRTSRKLLITLCGARHRGTPSLDGGELKIRPLTADLADGPCEFYRWTFNYRSGVSDWVLVGREKAVGVLE